MPFGQLIIPCYDRDQERGRELIIADRERERASLRAREKERER
jgi:hypothetical protein